MTIKGDLALADQVILNRQRQEQLAREDPQHPMRAFGEAVESAAPPPTGGREAAQELVQRPCEAAILQTLVPALTRVVDEAFSARLDGLVAQASAARAQWEQAMLQRVEAAIRDIHRASGARPVVNINTSARRAADLDRVNVDAPETAEDAAALRSNASPVTKYLRERWRPEWLRAGVRHTCVSLHFSILMQAPARGTVAPHDARAYVVPSPRPARPSSCSSGTSKSPSVDRSAVRRHTTQSATAS